MLGKGSAVFSISYIKSIYPDEWVAIAVTDTDADGFASAGEVIVHDSDEQLVWSATRLGDIEEPVYVFFTGTRRTVTSTA
ncbi:MAG TPA: hypothetical protein VNN73_16085 [Blastocatellia bacterium]|nr:hypothetical protein [Blastocatellia bacterium]